MHSPETHLSHNIHSHLDASTRQRDNACARAPGQSALPAQRIVSVLLNSAPHSALHISVCSRPPLPSSTILFSFRPSLLCYPALHSFSSRLKALLLSISLIHPQLLSLACCFQICSCTKLAIRSTAQYSSDQSFLL